MRSRLYSHIPLYVTLVGATSMSVGAAELRVGPPLPDACDGPCDAHALQAAVDQARPGDTILVYRRTDDSMNNQCYDEHVIVDIPLTIAGVGLTRETAACLGTSAGGDIMTITSSKVTLHNLHLSGRVNDGAGGSNVAGTGGRAFGHGVHVIGQDIERVIVHNCSIDGTFGDNLRFDGDRDADGVGSIQVLQSYLHHSDTGRNIAIYDGGGRPPQRHVVRNCLIHTGGGVQLDGDVAHARIERNIIKGWPFWGHFALEEYSEFPELGTASYGGGWRYYSNCPAGIDVDLVAGRKIHVANNLIIGTRVGVRAGAMAHIEHNTIVNPFNLAEYAYDGDGDPVDIRDNTFGIVLADGFAGRVLNNLVVVTADNRATGGPGQTIPPYYTPGITGTGIAIADEGSLARRARVRNNNVWGFVDIDGITPTNYAPSLDAHASNMSLDPEFALDHIDESHGGQPPCPADGLDEDDVRCFELYEDNYFLASTAGSCHAEALLDSAGAAVFLDLTAGGRRMAPQDAFSGLTECTWQDDDTASPLIDAGSEKPADETMPAGGYSNIGAFGQTSRASRSPQDSEMGLHGR